MKSFPGCRIFLTVLILITLAAPAFSDYCSATGGTHEYIYRVVVGDIDNTSSQSSYTDYTDQSTTMETGVSYEIEVYNGYQDDDDECGIWVDWNQDEDFDDADEQIDVNNTPGVGWPYKAPITPPANAVAGNTRMRIRITWKVTPLPCGTTSYGEVEDYTINVINIKGEINGVKFHDLNGNGIQDDGEPGLQDWSIYLDLNENGQLDDEPNTTTDESGFYQFPGLQVGDYTVAEVIPQGWAQTFPGWAGGRLFSFQIDSANDIETIIEVDPTDGSLINSFPAPANYLVLGPQGLAVGPTSLFFVDFSYTIDGAFVDVWELDMDSGYVIDHDQIDFGPDHSSRGTAYMNGKLYITKMHNFELEDFVQIVAWDPALDTVVDTITVNGVVGEGLAAAPDLNALFATKLPTQIVKIDPSNGSILDTLEPADVYISTALAYLDGNIFMGSYIAGGYPPRAFCIDPETGELLYTIYLPVLGNWHTALGADGLPAEKYNVSLEGGQTITVNFGNVELDSAGIQGTKWNDLNADGKRDANEPALEGWKIYIDANENGHCDEGEPYSITNSSGAYEFTGLTAGTYVIDEVSQADWQQTFPGGNGSHSVSVNVGRTLEDIDFGNIYVYSSEIHGSAYNDLDGNGVEDENDVPLENWIVFIDLNNNGWLDGDEPSTVTDANGTYEFTGLAPGSYSVAMITRCGWRNTSLLLNKQEFIEISGPRDLAFDYQRNLLYIGTEEGTVERYDLFARELLSPFTAGTSLNGMDITPDGSHLYLTENDISGNAVLHRLNLSNGTVTDITYSIEFGEAAGWDVKIGCCGKGFVTGKSGGAEHVPLREFDPYTTDSPTIRTGIPGSTSDNIAKYTRIFRSADLEFLMLTEGYNYSNIYVYDAITDTFTYEPDKISYFLALSRDASLVARATTANISILTQDFTPVTTVILEGDSSDKLGGMVFNSVRDIFYFANSETDQILAVDTKSWLELDRIDAAEGVDDYPPLYDSFANGVMAVSDDGRFLALTTGTGVYVLKIDGSQIVDVGLGETVNDIDFGHQQNMAGDFDGDRDVDTEDLEILCEQWLLEKFSADVAPYYLDGIVNFLDWSVFASAWQSTPESPNWISKCDISPDGGDDIVNWNDLAVFLDQWLEIYEYCADIAPAPDGDGIVNMLDFAAFAENWLTEME